MVSPMKIICLLLTLNFIHSAIAQPVKKSPKKDVITPVVKFKPPVVKTFLGRNEKEAAVTVDEANQLNILHTNYESPSTIVGC